MRGLLVLLWKDESGAAAVKYGLITASIALAIIAVPDMAFAAILAPLKSFVCGSFFAPARAGVSIVLNLRKLAKLVRGPSCTSAYASPAMTVGTDARKRRFSLVQRAVSLACSIASKFDIADRRQLVVAILYRI
jgi:Flp pilus assembly pilin Flp